jgi:AcrR family transcriptional regulator
VSSIVKAAGVSQGTFYNYFESKQALLAELRRGVFKRYAQALSETEGLELPPDEALAHTVARIVVVLQENLQLERVFREAETAGATQRAALQGRAKLSALAGRQIEAGVASGAFQTDDARLAARFIITLFDNILYESLVYEDPGTVSVVAAAALRFALAALGVPASRARALASPLESLCP